MAYTLVIVKDSRKLREARLAREAAKLASKDPKHVSEDVGVLTEKLYPNLKQETEMVVPDKSRRGCRALFDLTNIKEGLAAVLKDRPQHKRTFLLILIIIFEIEIFVIVGIIGDVFGVEYLMRVFLFDQISHEINFVQIHSIRFFLKIFIKN